MQYPHLWRDYFELCKPRVVALMTLTAIVAMFLAAPPGELSWRILIFGSLGITLAACSGGVVNQLIDRHIDAIMARTKGVLLPRAASSLGKRGFGRGF